MTSRRAAAFGVGMWLIAGATLAPAPPSAPTAPAIRRPADQPAPRTDAKSQLAHDELLAKARARAGRANRPPR